MPLEIKELHIKATISDSDNQDGNNNPDGSGAGQSVDEIVKVCVEKVMEILKDKADR